MNPSTRYGRRKHNPHTIHLFGMAVESCTRRNPPSTAVSSYAMKSYRRDIYWTVCDYFPLFYHTPLPTSLFVVISSVPHTVCGQIHALVATVETGFLTGIPTTMVADIAPSLKALDEAVMEHREVRSSAFHILKNSLGAFGHSRILEAACGTCCPCVDRETWALCFESA